MKKYKQAILPKGFKASGISCGIKKSGKLDLALFFSEIPAKASCLFTSSSMLAAPIVLYKNSLKRNRFFQAIIVNSGNANCFTGVKGLKDAEFCAGLAAKELNIKKEKVLFYCIGHKKILHAGGYLCSLFLGQVFARYF
mgnify:CR=1 FL=1